MEIKASLKHFHISPRKMRLVADLIKGLDAKRAELELIRLPKHAAEPLLKLLRSAMANARNNLQMGNTDLYIKGLQVSSGTVMKRFRPRAFGRAATIRKKTCHVYMILDTKSQTIVKEESLSGAKPAARGTANKDGKNDIPKSAQRKNLAPDSKAKKVKNKGFTKKIFSRKVI